MEEEDGKMTDVHIRPVMDATRPSVVAASEGMSMRKLDTVSLQALRAAFAKAAGVTDDILGEAALGPEAFVEAFAPAFRTSKEEMEALFYRVDVNENGLLGWDEFASFVLLNSSVATESTKLDEDRSFAHRYEPLPHRADLTRWVEHSDTITKILVHNRHPTLISASQDGTVKMWNSETLRHKRTILNGTAWITDVIHTPPHLPLYPNGSVIAASIDRVISLFDASSGDLIRTYRGKKKRPHDDRMEVQFRHPFGLPLHCAPSYGGQLGGLQTHPPSGETELDNLGTTELYSNTLRHFRRRQKIDMVLMEHLETVPWSLGHLRTNRKDLLLIGSDTGVIKIYDISRDVPSHEVSIPCENYDRATGRDGWDTGHSSTITKILPVPMMESIITSSKDTTLRLLDIETGVMLRVLGVEPNIPKDQRTPGMEIVHTHSDERLGHMKPVNTFSWCDDKRLIASCGRERHVLVWNPFISKPIMKLKGHRTPLVDAVFNSGEHQLITLSIDKVVKVWDLRTFQCVQTLPDTTKYPGEDRLGALAYDSRCKRIVTGSKRLHLRSMNREASTIGSNHHGREQLVSGAYSSEFKQVISVGVHRVITWDVKTQSSLVSWTVPQGVTACCLDKGQRRFLVGTRDGKVHLYNYLNANFLRACTTHYRKQEPRSGGGSDATSGDAAAAMAASGTAQSVFTDAEEPPPATDISTVGFHVVNTPSTGSAKLITSTKGNWLYVHEDTDTDQEVYPTIRAYLGDVKGVYCAAFMPPAMMLFGLGTGGVAVASIVDRSRPTIIARHLRAHYIGNVPGGLYTPALPISDRSPEFVDVAPLDGIMEDIVYLSRTARVVVGAHGDGTITVWDIPAARPGACKKNSFSFLAGYEKGDSITTLAVDTAERSLFAGTASGYYIHYDVASFGEDAASISPAGVVRVGGARVADQGLRQLTYLTRLEIMMGITVDTGLMLFTLEGYLLSTFRNPVQDLTQPLTAYRPLFTHTAAHDTAQRHFRAEWVRGRLLEKHQGERFTTSEAVGMVFDEFSVGIPQARAIVAYLRARWADMIPVQRPLPPPQAGTGAATARAPTDVHGSNEVGAAVSFLPRIASTTLRGRGGGAQKPSASSSRMSHAATGAYPFVTPLNPEDQMFCIRHNRRVSGGVGGNANATSGDTAHAATTGHVSFSRTPPQTGGGGNSSASSPPLHPELPAVPSFAHSELGSKSPFSVSIPAMALTATQSFGSVGGAAVMGNREGGARQSRAGFSPAAEPLLAAAGVEGIARNRLLSEAGDDTSSPGSDAGLPKRKRLTTHLAGAPGCFSADLTPPVRERSPPGRHPRNRHHRSPRNPFVVDENTELDSITREEIAPPTPQPPAGRYTYPKNLRKTRHRSGKFHLHRAAGGQWRQAACGEDDDHGEICTPETLGAASDGEEEAARRSRSATPPAAGRVASHGTAGTTPRADASEDAPAWLMESANAPVTPPSPAPAKGISLGCRGSSVQQTLLWHPVADEDDISDGSSRIGSPPALPAATPGTGDDDGGGEMVVGVWQHIGAFGSRLVDDDDAASTTLNTTPSPRVHGVWGRQTRPIDELFQPSPPPPPARAGAPPQQQQHRGRPTNDGDDDSDGGWGASVKAEVCSTMSKAARQTTRAVMCFGDEEPTNPNDAEDSMSASARGSASPPREGMGVRPLAHVPRDTASLRRRTPPAQMDAAAVVPQGALLVVPDAGPPAERKTPKTYRGRPLFNEVTSSMFEEAANPGSAGAAANESDEELREKISQVRFQILADQPIRLRAQPLPPNKAPKPMEVVEMADVRNPSRTHRKLLPPTAFERAQFAHANVNTLDRVQSVTTTPK